MAKTKDASAPSKREAELLAQIEELKAKMAAGGKIEYRLKRIHDSQHDDFNAAMAGLKAGYAGLDKVKVQDLQGFIIREYVRGHFKLEDAEGLSKEERDKAVMAQAEKRTEEVLAALPVMRRAIIDLFGASGVRLPKSREAK